MAVRPLPIEIELVIYARTNLRRRFRWLPDGTNAQDFTGWTALCLIGPRGGEAIYELDTTNQGVVLGADGLITVSLDDSETDAVKGTGLYWQLDLSDPTGFVQRFLRGRVTVVRDVEPFA